MSCVIIDKTTNECIYARIIMLKLLIERYNNNENCHGDNRITCETCLICQENERDESLSVTTNRILAELESDVISAGG